MIWTNRKNNTSKVSKIYRNSRVKTKEVEPKKCVYGECSNLIGSGGKL